VGPVTVPSGWTERYNSGQAIGGSNFEWIAVAELQVDNKTATGANTPTGTGVGTSNFTLTNADNCSMFSFVLEGAISTGVGIGGAVSLQASPTLKINYNMPPVPVGGVLLTALPQISVRTIVRGGVNLYALSTITFSASVFPRGALIILPNLTFGTQQTFFQGILLQAIAVLRAGALPYRRPVLRTDYVYPPLNHPFRLIAQRILDGEIIEWELPVAEDFEYTDQLSGPVVMHGSFRPEQISVQELGLDGYAYWLHVEINQEIRASAILLPPQYEESAMTFSAEGVTAVPHYTVYDGRYSQIQVDPLSIVRTLWNYVQSQPQSDYGVTVSVNSSPVRLGETARTETTTTNNSDGTTTITTREIPAAPYELNWWDAKNVGEEIDSLAGQTPFDYVERHKWNADRTDVLHYVDLLYPRAGVARPNLLFNEENILEVVPVQEPEDSYASAVLVIGAGDGVDTIRAYRAESFADRVRKEVVITDKSITSQQLADSRAAQELAFRRGRAFEIGELVVAAYHTNAPIGSYAVGDDIQVQVEISWLMELHTSWYRITSINNKPSSDKVRLGLQRSTSILDTSDIWIQPDDYVPFTPPPPIGSVAWSGIVGMVINSTLVVFPGIPVPTARAIMPVLPVITVNGQVFGGSFAFVNNLFTFQSLTIGNPQQTSPVAIVLTSSASISANGVATAPGFSSIDLVINSGLSTGPITINIVSLPLTAVSTLSAGASVASNVGISATLSASASLTMGAKLTAQGAVSLSAASTLSTSGVVTSGATTSQLGKTSDGASQSSSSANKTVVSKVTASVAGTVIAGHARLWVDSGTASVEMCVYADSGGAPGSLLGLSGTLTVSNTTEAQKDFTFTGTQQAVLTSGTDYWIGFTWPDPGTNNIFWSRDGTASSAQQNSLHAAASFGTPGTALSGPIDAYVDVSSTTGGGGGGSSSIVIRSSASAAEGNTADVVCPKPPGLATGDYLLAFQMSDRDGTLADCTSAQFTTVLTSIVEGTTSPCAKVWGKVATSTDAGRTSFTFSDNTSANSTVVMVAIQAGTYNSASPVSGFTWTTVNSAGSGINAPSITGTNGAVLLTAHMPDTNGSVLTFTGTPTSMTLVAQSVAGNSTYTRMAIYEQDLTASGATGTKTATLSGSARGYKALAFQVNPA
jgi:hypothetical protein